MTVGMMAGFYAAWTAPILFYLCVALTSSLGDSRWALAGVLTASVTLLYIHPWTWIPLMAILAIDLAISMLRSIRKKLKLDKNLLAVLIVNGLVDIFKTAISPAYGGVESSIPLAVGVQRSWLNNLLHQPWYMHRLMKSYVNGLFFNPLHVLLASVGALGLLKRGANPPDSS